MAAPDDWAPDACTLPSADRPLRISEFDDLFGHVLRSARSKPTRLELLIPSNIEAAARDLARRENECCAFFRFEFGSAGENATMRIAVPPEQVAVLDAIEARVAKR